MRPDLHHLTYHSELSLLCAHINAHSSSIYIQAKVWPSFQTVVLVLQTCFNAVVIPFDQQVELCTLARRPATCQLADHPTAFPASALMIVHHGVEVLMNVVTDGQKTKFQ